MTEQAQLQHDDDTKDLKIDEVEILERVPATSGASDLQATSAFASLSGFAAFRKFKRVYFVCCAVTLGGMYAGYCGAAGGNIVANPGFIEQFGTLVDAETGLKSLDAKYVSLWSGLTSVGQAATQLVAPIIADKFGRKWAMWSLAGLMTLSIVMQIVAKEWKVFLVAKTLSGAATAFVGAAVLTYMSEIAPPAIRGATLAVFAFTYGLGQFFNAIALQILVDTTPMLFRNVFYSEFVMLGLFLPVIVWVPESPVWLCMQGQHEKAKLALLKVVGNVDGYEIEHEYAVIRAEVDESLRSTAAQSTQQWAALFRWKSFKRVLAASLPITMQMFVGVPLVFGYTTYFFQIAGLANPFIGSVIVYALLQIGIVGSFFVVDRVGRRPLLLIGGCILAAICASIGGLGFKVIDSKLGSVLVALCAIWVFTYALCLAPIGYTSLVEISSPALRAKTASIAMLGQAFSGLIFIYALPYMLSPQYAGWESKVGLFFCGTALLGLVPCYFLFPETKGRTYTEIDELYARGISPRHFASTKTSVDKAREAAASGMTSEV